jgi:glycosyltransferase involved in cell wall biosynthesis
MKVLVLSSGSYKSILALRVIALAQHLAKMGAKVTLIAPSADKYNNFTPDTTPVLSGVRVIQPWQLTTKSAIVNLVPYLFTSLAAVLRVRADVIYLCKPTPITIVGLLPRLLLRTPVILDLDDLGSEVMKLQGQSVLQYKLVAWCERVAMHYATGVVVASTYLETWVKETYPTKSVVIIPNGVEPTDYPVASKIVPRHAIYYFGAVNRLSLIETLLRSLPAVIGEIPDTIVTIVGGGSALPEAKRIVEELSLTASVTFTDWVAFLDIQKYVQPADVAICYQPDALTMRAASNMKVFQYMAMSTVPVVSDVGDLASYVDYGRIGAVVPAEDLTRLSHTLIGLLNDDKKRTRISLAARKAAENEYSWAARAEKLSDFMKTFSNTGKVQ